MASRTNPERKSIVLDLGNWRHLVLLLLTTLGAAKGAELISTLVNPDTTTDTAAGQATEVVPQQPVSIEVNLEFNAPPILPTTTPTFVPTVDLATATDVVEITEAAEIIVEETEPAPLPSPTATATIQASPSPTIVVTLPPANLPEEPADENVSLGFHNEGEPLLTSAAIYDLTLQTLNDLANHPELSERILANQRWMDDLLNPVVTNWADRNLLERDFRGLGFTPTVLMAAAGRGGAWDALFTPDSILRSEDPTHIDSSEVLFQFAVDPIDLARNGQLNVAVEHQGGRYYYADYANIANMQPVLYTAAVDAIVAANPTLDEATVRQAATIFADSWRQFHGFTNAAGLTNVDTNGSQAGGIVSFRYDPFLRVCEVYQLPADSNDPIDQTETTRRVDSRPIIVTPGELTLDIPWGNFESNARGRNVTALRVDMGQFMQGMAGGEGAGWIANQLLLASAQTTWNVTDNYTNVPSDYETEIDAVWHTFVPCGEAPVVVAPVEIIPPPNIPPENTPPPERTPPPDDEKSPPGNQTNPDGETEPDPTGGQVIIDGEIDTDNDGVGDIPDNIGSGR